MALLKIRNVTNLVILSDPSGGELLRVETAHDVDKYLSVSILDRIHEQIQAYVNSGIMTYTVEDDPAISDDLENCAIEASKYIGNSIRKGIIISQGKVPSDIADYRLDHTMGEVYVNGKHVFISEEITWSYISNGIQLDGSVAVVLPEVGTEYYAMHVFKQEGVGKPRLKSIFGDWAVTGNALIPTAAQITDTLGYGTWLLVAQTYVHRLMGGVIYENFTNFRNVPPSFK